MWEDFKGTKWQKDIDVANFIESNYKEYKEDESFLTMPSNKTCNLWSKCKRLFSKESVNGILDVETFIMSGIDNFEPGYVSRSNEVIVGLQTDEPLKRIINPYIDFESTKHVLEVSGFHVEKELEHDFEDFRKEYKKAIEDSYTEEIKLARKNNLLSSLPEGYSRGYIIGDYRRLALYGADFLIERKIEDLNRLVNINDLSTIQLRENINDQIKSLKLIVKMASRYGYDVTKPASSAKEAIQWTYFAYLAAIKQNSGYSLSIGRNSSFFDIYIERDIEKGILTEVGAQELIDQFIMKLRLVRQIRDSKYTDLFSGDSTWITETIGGMLNDEQSLITKTSYRMLNTLKNMDGFTMPSLTILWSKKLPEPFKKYVSKLSIDTNSLQIVNDDLIRTSYGSDYAIDVVSPLKLGEQSGLFGSRINFPKILLYALNGGKDEITGDLVIDGIEQIEGEYLDVEEVLKQFDKVLKKAMKIYVDALNIDHYMHDKYAYESSPMAFINSNPTYFMSFGITGLSSVVDSFSAIQFGHVRVKRNDIGLTQAFDVEFDYPKYGNNDDNVDAVAKNLIKRVYREIRKYPIYKNAIPMISLTTDSSNVVYGKNTGATPDGRKENIPFAQGASPQNSECKSMLNSILSVAKLPYKDYTEAGIFNSVLLAPNALGENKIENIINILDKYFSSGGFHLGISIIEKETLENAISNPSRYPNLILSSYPVYFSKLSEDVKKSLSNLKIYEQI